jgi:eukaryotic-like serine/threonine-protein kinase
MGVVYRARDTRLGREVALKLVPPGLLDDEGARKRFRQEARALSTLNHANIATLYEFDSDQGVEFLVMELVAGTSLRGRVTAGPLPVRQVIAFGVQIVNGLAAAHGAGIVHRDLKPENLVVTPEGQIKILDFGVAKLTPPVEAAARTASFVTDPGAAVGTVPYMAPEQLRGETTDHRVDIYAAGAVLYEMATGRLPFEGRGMALAEAILTRDPVPPEVLNPQVPAPLSQIILKALDKEPRRRYQSARELAVDLERLSEGATRTAPVGVFTRMRGWKSPLLVPIAIAMLLAGVWLGTRGATPAAGAAIQSVAVLPLSNLSGDPQQEYFTDGMTEELTSDLAKLGALRVIGRTSVMQYKGTKKTVPEIARELNVDAVIEGSVLRAGNRVRITAQLVGAKPERHLWSDSYDGDLSNVLDLQRDVARAIAGQVQAKLTPQQQNQLAERHPIPPDAHDLYLQGRYHLDKGTQDEINTAMNYFQQAAAKYPQYAQAYAGLADSYFQLAALYKAPREVMPKAKEAAEKAIALDESIPEAHVALGVILFTYDWDWARTEREVKRALELNPNSSAAHDGYAMYLVSMGRFDQALAESARAHELDPYSLAIMADRCWIATMARKYDLAVETGKQVVAMEPKFPFGHMNLSIALAQNGQLSEAVAESEIAHQLDDSPMVTSILAGIYAQAGRKADAENTLALLQEQLKRRYSCSYEVAVVYINLGQVDEAFRWMDRAWDARSDCMVFTKIDPRLVSLHPDPRYQALLQKLRFPD